MMQLRFETELVKTQMEIQEQTMQTIGADLHDNIGQLLSLTALTLKSAKNADTEKVNQKVDDAIDLTSRSIKEMRLLGKLLQGEQLVDSGLEKAIQFEIDWIIKVGQFQVNYRFEGSRPETFNTNKELILFRILQEILNNIFKHSKASRIDIYLVYGSGFLTLEIADNGIGFIIDDKEVEAVGMGLRNIQKRTEIIGGTLMLSASPGNGTRIHLNIPYP
jgi:signal transduction histidine kinase